MRRTTLTDAARTALLLLLAGALSSYASAGDSLADAARREQERRKKRHEEAPPAAVIGHEELSAAKGETLAQEPATPAKKPRAENTGSVDPSWPPGDDGASEEEAWRARMANARARVDSAQKNYDKIHDTWVGYGQVLVDAQGRAVAWNQQQVEVLRQNAREKLDAAKSALARLEEDARRAGVPPGWLR